MAVPAYTEDLVDIDLAEIGSSGTAINYSGGGGGAPAAGIDLAMQGSDCWDRPVSAAERAIVFNQTPGAGVIAAGAHVYQWLIAATPGLTDTIALRGAYVVIGTGTNATVQFHVEGNDTYGASGRNAKCYPVRYNTTPAAGLRTVVGNPGATPTFFGGGLKTLGTAKGSNLGVDAVRYGTGAYLTAGELLSAGDPTDNPCTFSGFNTQNDVIGNRWGIFTSVGGSFELQGTFAMGQNNAGTPTLVRFRSNDVNIVIPDALHVESGFNKFVFDHVSSRIEWTNINITSFCVLSAGALIVTANNPTIIFTGGTFTGIGLTTLQSNTTATGTTWRTSGTVTSNGSSLLSCIFEATTSDVAVNVNNLSELDECNFIGDNTSHAVNLGTIAASTSMSWNNNFNTTTYAAASQAANAASASGDSEVLLVNVASGQTLTINVVGGIAPSYRNTGPGSVAIVASVTYTVTNVIDQSEVRIINTTLDTILGGVETIGATPVGVDNVVVDADPNNAGRYRVRYSYNQTDAPIAARIVVMNLDYIHLSQNVTLGTAAGELLVSQQLDRNYINP